MSSSIVTVTGWAGRAWRASIALVVVDVLARVLVVGRVRLSYDRVGPAGPSVGLAVLGAVPLHQRGEVSLLSPEPRLYRRTAGPQTVAPHNTPGPPAAPKGNLSTPHDRLHLPNIDGSDGAGVHHGLRSVGGRGSGLMAHQAGPLLGKSDKLVVGGIETCVDSVLEVCRSGYLRLFLLLGEHTAGLVRPLGV